MNDPLKKKLNIVNQRQEERKRKFLIYIKVSKNGITSIPTTYFFVLFSVNFPSDINGNLLSSPVSFLVFGPSDLDQQVRFV